MLKYKLHTLYAKIEGANNSKYSFEESLRNDTKRQQPLMSGQMIEDLDKLTSKYESAEDLLISYPKEVWDADVFIYEPIIIVDKDEFDRSKSYYITDIVFAKDKVELQNKDYIKRWLLDYLLNNPHDIKEFRGIKEIYENLSKTYSDKSIGYIINMTVMVYFKGNNYKKYREAYFTLKKLDYKRVKKNEIHR